MRVVLWVSVCMWDGILMDDVGMFIFFILFVICCWGVVGLFVMLLLVFG